MRLVAARFKPRGRAASIAPRDRPRPLEERLDEGEGGGGGGDAKML